VRNFIFRSIPHQKCFKTRCPKSAGGDEAKEKLHLESVRFTRNKTRFLPYLAKFCNNSILGFFFFFFFFLGGGIKNIIVANLEKPVPNVVSESEKIRHLLFTTSHFLEFQKSHITLSLSNLLSFWKLRRPLLVSVSDMTTLKVFPSCRPHPKTLTLNCVVRTCKNGYCVIIMERCNGQTSNLWEVPILQSSYATRWLDEPVGLEASFTSLLRFTSLS